MEVAKSPVKGEHDLTKKCKYFIFCYPFEALILCNSLMFFNYNSKSFEVEKNKRLINNGVRVIPQDYCKFSKSKGWSGWMHVKILICSRKCWEIQPQLWLNHICRPFLSSSFFFSLSPSTFFAHAQLLTFYVFINHIDNLSALFQSFVISVKDDNFQSTSFFY